MAERGIGSMKVKSKILVLMGVAATGALVHKYVTDHKEELDRFIDEYGEVLENDYQQEDLIEPQA